MAETGQIVKKTRRFRTLHKYVAIPVFAFIFIVSITGILLGWKKQTGILPSTQKSTLGNDEPWLNTEYIITKAEIFMKDTLHKECSIDRLDYRPDRGIVKILFSPCFYEIQMDGKTGKILSHERRYSDLIERIHDGSILDYIFGDKTKFLKLGYTTWLSLSLMILSISGFFLWYNPKVIRKLRKEV